MPKFSDRSKKHLSGAHPELQMLFNRVIEHWDHTVIDADRSEEEQVKNVQRGVSKTMDSKHVVGKKRKKSDAVDAMAYPIEWGPIEKGIRAVKEVDKGLQTLEAYLFHGFVLGYAAALKDEGVMHCDIRSGVDWDGDGELQDHTFIDLPHFERDV